jgi:ABC-2 type transport system ATP-binding protein
VLELLNLSKRYGAVVALDGLSFEVDAGQVLGFVGPNGAGKTTAMRIVIGVLAPDSGVVRWRGAPIDERVRTRIGYMPEERGLYPKMRVRDQLRYLAELHDLEPQAAESNATQWLQRLGVSERADDPVERLSLGNQQRVQLAAALVHGPDLLVLDEPFSGLDPVGVDVLSEVLFEEARSKGVPIVFSSHQLELVERLCDAVAIVRDGSLVASGRVDELRAARSTGRWRVEVQGHDDAWAERIASVERIGEHLFRLDGVDPQALLDAAQRAGPVRLFAPDESTLAELFRDVIVEPEAEP